MLAIDNTALTQDIKTRFVAEGAEATVWTDIYQDDCNMAIWKRELAPELPQHIDAFLKSNCRFQTALTLSPQNALSDIQKALGSSEATALLSEDIAELVKMFCYLFELDHTGLRLTALDKAMCPRFHVDRVPCRLLTTYQGEATEWLHHRSVDRSKLGKGSEGKTDQQARLFRNAKEIRQLNAGDVALLKGENWQGNEGAGLVHRSPAVLAGEMRLLLTLDIN